MIYFHRASFVWLDVNDIDVLGVSTCFNLVVYLTVVLNVE